MGGYERAYESVGGEGDIGKLYKSEIPSFNQNHTTRDEFLVLIRATRYHVSK